MSGSWSRCLVTNCGTVNVKMSRVWCSQNTSGLRWTSRLHFNATDLPWVCSRHRGDCVVLHQPFLCRCWMEDPAKHTMTPFELNIPHWMSSEQTRRWVMRMIPGCKLVFLGVRLSETIYAMFELASAENNTSVLRIFLRSALHWIVPCFFHMEK